MEREGKMDSLVRRIQNSIAGLTDLTIDLDHVYFYLPNDQSFHSIRLLEAPLLTLRPLSEALDSALRAPPEGPPVSARSLDLYVCQLDKDNGHRYGIAIRPEANLYDYGIDSSTGGFVGRKLPGRKKKG